MKPQNPTQTMTPKVAHKQLATFKSYYQLDKPVLRGMGNIVDIFATTYDLDFILRSDRDALLSDVANVGRDMRIAIAQYQY